MAERYGVKPKKFTKEWWPYYWMYYKWHTVAGVVAGFMIITTAVQCATSVKYDVNVIYTGSSYLSEESVAALEEEMSAHIDDIDNNGEKNAFFQTLIISNMKENAEMDYAMMTKHDLEMAAESTFLFVYDKAKAEQMLSRDDAADIYMPVEQWYEGDLSGKECMKNAGGIDAAISLADSEIMKSAGMDSSGMYVAVRAIYGEKDSTATAQKNAIKLANELLK